MRYPNASLRARRRAVTLIELLVAIAATLVLMTAVTQVIDMLGSGMANNRATIEMMDQLRSVRQKLQSDLAGHTAQALPWQDAETGGGYIEVIEGLKKDHPKFWPNNDNRFGDVDDVIALTVRSQGPPFISTTGISDDESYVAEVVWYLKRNQDAQPDEQVLYTLYRHVELVGSNRVGGGDSTEGELGKLTMRENRWGPRSGQMPFDLNPDNLIRRREDLVLTNVLSFDVKVWDPQAPIYADASNENRVMAPGDPGYTSGGTVIGLGAYVDLSYLQEPSDSSTPTSHFSSRPNPPTSGWNSFPVWVVWDTWPRFYERDGKDQDGDSLVDEGYNGLDDDAINGVDDPGELETSPPYSHPLRGIRVTIRIYEPASQQVRQLSVVQHFMPE